MAKDRPATTKLRRSRIGATIKALIRTRVSAGLITILPIVLTVWLVRVVFGWLRDASLWVVDAFLLSPFGREVLTGWGIDPQQLESSGLEILPPRMQWSISIFSVLLTFFVLYLIGLFMTNVIGRRLLDLVEFALERLPFVKTIYHTLKQVFAVFSADRSKGFQRVALIPYPNQITRSVGFITNSFRDAITGDELCSVFLPTAPNPTSGFVLIYKRSDIVEPNWSVEDAAKVIMSGGILSPEYMTMVPGVHTQPEPDIAPADEV
jgi:uncharacterized membrane protein